VLPAAVARAPKRGFEVPVARWLAHDLREMVGDLLLSGQSKVSELGNGAAIARLVQGTDDFSGNRTQTVWALLMLEIFLRDGC
jgi:asparagine synthase (glutamine-hydrolysing)